jgi:hypothetical protein
MRIDRNGNLIDNDARKILQAFCQLGGEDPVVMVCPMACGHPVLPMAKPNKAERRSLEVVVIILRRLFFATCILFGLAFAVICYAEMLGVVKYD